MRQYIVMKLQLLKALVEMQLTSFDHGSLRIKASTQFLPGGRDGSGKNGRNGGGTAKGRRTEGKGERRQARMRKATTRGNRPPASVEDMHAYISRVRMTT